MFELSNPRQQSSLTFLPLHPASGSLAFANLKLRPGAHASIWAKNPGPAIRGVHIGQTCNGEGPELATPLARMVAVVDRYTSRLIAGIRFADYVFAEPVPLGPCWISLQMTGIYAILVPDPSWGPRQFQPIFFGVCNGQRPCPLSVDEYNACVRAASGKVLYIAMYNLPPLHDPSESNRIQWELIQVYSPLCNRDSGDSHSGELAHKLEALEKKNQEHEVLLKVLLAAVGHPAQPPQEIKRRAVGFQPAESSANRQSTPRRGVLQNSYWD